MSRNILALIDGLTLTMATLYCVWIADLQGCNMAATILAMPLTQFYGAITIAIIVFSIIMEKMIERFGEIIFLYGIYVAVAEVFIAISSLAIHFVNES